MSGGRLTRQRRKGNREKGVFENVFTYSRFFGSSKCLFFPRSKNTTYDRSRYVVILSR